jgi:hypothetical protein
MLTKQKNQQNGETIFLRNIAKLKNKWYNCNEIYGYRGVPVDER